MTDVRTKNLPETIGATATVDRPQVTADFESPTFRVTVIIDGTVVVSREFKREHAAIRAYDRATALHSVGERRPKTSGIARVDRNFEPLKRCDWKLGFGWY